MEEKKTRRNKRILIVSAMLVLLLGILCFGGVTFAKYITSKDAGTQQATVAKWGYVVTADVTNIFGEAYKKGSEDTSKAVAATESSLSVLADNAGGTESDTVITHRVAPGTSGSMTITIKGEAEVASKIVFTQTVSDADMKDVSLKYGDGENDVYKPIVWTLTKKGGATALNDSDKTLKGAIKALSDEFDGTVKAPATKVDSEYTLTWEWKFTNATAGAKDDEYDTVLGDAAAMTDAEFAEKYGAADGADTVYKKANAVTNIKFGFSISVQQSETGATA